MMLYWGFDCICGTGKPISRPKPLMVIVWCIVRVYSCQAYVRWMRMGAVNPPPWLMTNVDHKLTTDIAISNTWEKHCTPQKQILRIKGELKTKCYTPV
jgi:hypothetical protein